MKKWTKFIAAIVGVMALSGCLVPENFTASVSVDGDGSYSYKYAGTTVFIPALLEMKKTGAALSPKAEKDLQDNVGKIVKSTDVQKASYIGNGRYDISIAGVRKPGQTANVLDAFRVFTDKDGVLNITSVALKPSDKAELAKLGLNINGKLSVSLPKNAEVVSSNATSSPTFFGLFGAYSWTIGSIDERPTMKIRLR